MDQLIRSDDDIRSDWERQVLAQSQHRCANCGSEQRLRVSMVVPKSAGGQLVPTNGVALCRVCEMARESTYKRVRSDDKRPVNLHVSRQFHSLISNGLQSSNGFQSMSSLVSYLVNKFVLDEARFDDLEQYQDEGNDVKINLWLPRDDYKVFKTMVGHRGLTVTDSIKALVLMFADHTAPLRKE